MRRAGSYAIVAAVGGLLNGGSAATASAQTSPYGERRPPEVGTSGSLPPGVATPGVSPPTPATNEIVPATFVAPAGAAPVPLAPAPQAQPVPLTQAEGRNGTKLPLPGADKSPTGGSRGGGWPTVLAGLGFVLGLFLVCARLLRRGMPQTARPLPKEAVETLGRMALPGRRQGQLLRVGNKVVLVSFSAAGADVLVEIDDPVEIDRLAGLCAATDPQGATQSFRGIVENFFREKPTGEKTTRAKRGAAASGREEDLG
jgi:flagellar biogenesis protein FliO